MNPIPGPGVTAGWSHWHVPRSVADVLPVQDASGLGLGTGKFVVDALNSETFTLETSDAWPDPTAPGSPGGAAHADT